MKIPSVSLTAIFRRVTLLLVLFSAAVSNMAGAQTLERIVETGVMRVAMSGDQQPFSFKYGRSNRVVGYDVDLAGELARALSVELEIVTIPFNDLMAALADGRADMVISGMTITAPRTLEVSFVGPYMLSGKSILMTERAARERTRPADLNEKGVKLVALRGSTSESFVQRELPEPTLIPIADYAEGVKQLMAGEVDGMVADLPILAYTRNSYPNANLQLLTPPLSVEPMGIVIAKGDSQLENLMRNYLAVLEETGMLLNLYDRWFGVGAGDLYRQ